MKQVTEHSKRVAGIAHIIVAALASYEYPSPSGKLLWRPKDEYRTIGEAEKLVYNVLAAIGNQQRYAPGVDINTLNPKLGILCQLALHAIIGECTTAGSSTVLFQDTNRWSPSNAAQTIKDAELCIYEVLMDFTNER